jgi:hypothetical protein
MQHLLVVEVLHLILESTVTFFVALTKKVTRPTRAEDKTSVHNKVQQAKPTTDGLHIRSAHPTGSV